MLSKKIRNFLLFTLVIKILLASFIPLFSDEAYYWIWSKNMQLSYYDHPAMVAWLIKLGSVVFPFHNELSVRLFFIILSTATLWIWKKISEHNKISENTQLIILSLICLNPLLGIGSILATPDVPLVFFWSLSFLAFNRAIYTSNYKWYALLGISLGLGFCSKYHIVLFVLSGIVYLLLSQGFKHIKITGALITILFGFIFSLPVLLWNYQNDWASFAFQLKHGFGRPIYKLHWTTGYVIGQFLLISPLIFLNLFKSPRKSSNKIFSLTQLVFFLTSSFKSVVEANWPVTAHLHAISSTTENNSNIHKKTFFYWLVIYGCVFVLLLWPDQRKKIFSIQKNTITINQLTEDVKNLTPLYGPTYQISSLLSWSLQKSIPKLKGLSRFDFFDTLPASIPDQKEFYVLRDIHSGWPEFGYNVSIEKIKDYPDLELELFHIIRSD